MRCHLTLDPHHHVPLRASVFPSPSHRVWLQSLCEMSVPGNWSSGRLFVPVRSFSSSSLPVGSLWSDAILPFVRQGAISRSSVSIHNWRWGEKIWWMMKTLIWLLILKELTPRSDKPYSYTLTPVENTTAQCSQSSNAHYLQVTHFSVMWGSDDLFLSGPVAYRWMENTVPLGGCVMLKWKLTCMINLPFSNRLEIPVIFASCLQLVSP